MLRDGLIDPRLDTSIEELCRNVTVTLDDNPDHNALSPQVVIVHLRDGTTVRRAVSANPGSPQAPLSPVRAQAKLNLCRALAPAAPPRLFSEPLAFATEPK
jgi:hypothetical protein